MYVCIMSISVDPSVGPSVRERERPCETRTVMIESWSSGATVSSQRFKARHVQARV